MAWVTKLQGSDGALHYQGRYRDPFGAKRAVGTYLLAAVIVSGANAEALSAAPAAASRSGSTRMPKPGSLLARGESLEALERLSEGARRQAVPGESTFSLADDGARLAKQAQVVADGGLLRAGDVNQVAGAQLLARQRLDDLQSQRVR